MDSIISEARKIVDNKVEGPRKQETECAVSFGSVEDLDQSQDPETFRRNSRY
jgi:hypothetical protein